MCVEMVNCVNGYLKIWLYMYMGYKIIWLMCFVFV